jgi:putative copper export protein
MSWARIEIDSYWALFVAAFIAVAVWESFRPKRELSSAVEKRWSRHGAIALASIVFPALLYRVGPVILAMNSSSSRFGF